MMYVVLKESPILIGYRGKHNYIGKKSPRVGQKKEKNEDSLIAVNIPFPISHIY
jgi:hypothetical protein